jgi:hypothetical protein
MQSVIRASYPELTTPYTSYQIYKKYFTEIILSLNSRLGSQHEAELGFHFLKFQPPENKTEKIA